MIITTEGERGVKNHLHVKKNSIIRKFNLELISKLMERMVKIGGMDNLYISSQVVDIKFHKRLKGKQTHIYIDEEFNVF